MSEINTNTQFNSSMHDGGVQNTPHNINQSLGQNFNSGGGYQPYSAVKPQILPSYFPLEPGEDDIMNCNGLVKFYGKQPALNGINLNVPKGKIIGLLGPNGSGKTTLIKLACGLLQPSSGTIKINGTPVGVETKKVVAYLPERNYLPDIKVIDAVNLLSDFYANFNRQKALDMLAVLRIDANLRIKALSKGTKEKVQLVLVMSREADLYLLDEPIAGVDPAARDFILNTIVTNYNSNATLIISTHLITDIEPILEDVIMIQQGNIRLHKSVDAIRAECGMSVDALFREVYRCY